MPKSILLLPLAVAALACAGANAAPASKTVATASALDVRATVVATRTGGGAAPAARVTVELDRRAAGRWQHAVTQRLAGTYFWNSVTGPAAICRLDLTTAGAGHARPRVVVQLLVTPSIGCGRAQTVTLTG